MKEMTSVATTVMSEEERAELDSEIRSNAGVSPSVSGVMTPPESQPTPASPTPNGASLHPDAATTSQSDAQLPSHPAAHSSSSSHSRLSTHGEPDKPPSPGDVSNEKGKADVRAKRGRGKLTPEQKQKLADLDQERRKAMEERINSLTQKLIDRIRPFVEAAHPGEKDDPETIVFQQRMQREADDLKLESFGVEVRIVLHSLNSEL